MLIPLDEQAMADLLPGRWIVAATSFPVLPAGQGRPRAFEYELMSRDPLVLSDSATLGTHPGEGTRASRRAGATKRIVGRQIFRGDGFHRRGALRVGSTRWTVAGASGDGSIVVIHVGPSRRAPAGVEVLVRDGVHEPELRAVIAHATENYGLTLEQFATLRWLGISRRP